VGVESLIKKGEKMSNVIRSASEVWESQSHKEFDEACACVMRAIEKASDVGLRDTVFDPRPVAYYDSFKPTGVIGGVRQDCEQICW